MTRHLCSCLSMMASHIGTCVVIPGWNGPKSPCHNHSALVILATLFASIPSRSYPDEVKHAAVLADLELRQDAHELVLGLKRVVRSPNSASATPSPPSPSPQSPALPAARHPRTMNSISRAESPRAAIVPSAG